MKQILVYLKNCCFKKSDISDKPFDYTEWQREHFNDTSLEEINKQAAQYCKNNQDQ